MSSQPAKSPNDSAHPTHGASAPTLSAEDNATRPSIFLKLNRTDPAPRELAWRQFYDRYAPVIQQFARRSGATLQQADEVTQDVIFGFFQASPRFVYDPAHGRFRGYLKTCTCRALAHLRTARPSADVPVEELAIPDDRDEELWERLWQQQILDRAMEIVRAFYKDNGKLETFLAFEQNVVDRIPAPEVAKRLGMNLPSVYTAKNRVTEKLREVRAAIEDEDG